MKIPFVPQRPRDYAIELLTLDDLAAVAAIHREDTPRPWSEEEFAGLLSEETVFGFVARMTGHGRQEASGYVLARLAAGEGEILSVAVARVHRRQGLGWRLLHAVLRELHVARAEALFLEVDETNRSAIALYKRLGFVQVGKRAGYYQAADTPATGALVMRRDLR